MENEVELKVVMYHWLVVGLTLISFLNVALMIIRLGDWQTEWWVATGLTIIFAIDYGIRLIKAKNRKSFLITSAFDLLGIIPMHPGFVIFRLARLVRIIRYHHLFWHLGISGKWTRNFHRFVYDTGFIYLFAISVAIISLSAPYFLFEHRSLPHCGGRLRLQLPWDTEISPRARLAEKPLPYPNAGWCRLYWITH